MVFLAAHKAVLTAEGAWAKENTEALAALAVLDKPYHETLALVAAYLPHEVLPQPLKSLPTDTDRMRAISDLVDLPDENHAAAWATELMSGKLGTQAPKTVTGLEEANKAYSEARDDRATAHGPAYERSLSFKKAVRAAIGPKSKKYQRIHIPSGKTDEPAEPTPQPAPPAS